MIAHTSDDYLKLFQSLLPPGKLWTRDPDADLTKVLHGLSEECARIEQRAYDLIDESLPSLVSELLLEWEAEYGILEEDIEGKTTEQRVATIVTKYNETGGTYAGYFEDDIGANLGYTITIDYSAPFWCGYSTCGDPVGLLVNQFWWRVLVEIEDGINYNLEQLMYEITRFKAGHTHVVFDFTGRAFSSALSVDFDAFPDFDNSWGGNGYGKIANDGFDFGREFDSSFTNAYDYDGIMLTGGFDQGFCTGFDRHSGGAFEHHSFTTGFFRPN